MKTTLGVALTPPTAAALIAGACVLAAAFLPSCHTRGLGAGEPPQLTAAPPPPAPAPAPIKVDPKRRAPAVDVPATAPETGSAARSQR